jgi:hypothetical protein
MQSQGFEWHEISSGGGGIRTLDCLAAVPVFKTGAIGRSATPPGDAACGLAFASAIGPMRIEHVSAKPHAAIEDDPIVAALVRE